MPSQPRLNFYAPIHKALRLSMTRLLVAIGATDWRDEREVALRVEEIGRQLFLGRRHLEHEDRFIAPLLAVHGAAAGHKVDEDHDAHHRRFAAIEGHVAALEAAAPEARAEAGHALYLAFADFVAHDFEHMAFEERVVMPWLHAHYDDGQLHEAHERLLAAIAPAEMLAILGVMLPAIDPGERAAMLGGMRMGMPPEMFAGVLAAARDALEEASWTRLEADLDGLAQAA